MPTINQTHIKLVTGAVIAAFSPLVSHAACVNVGGTGGCFASIQQAIDSAAFGETINVAAGLYYESNIRMNQQVDLVGAGRDATIIDGSLDNGDGTRRNGPRPAVIYYSVFNDPRITTTISDLTIRGGYRGVDAGRFNTTTLLRVRLTGNGPGSGAGAFINAERLIVRDSLVDNNFALDGLGCDWYWDGGGAGGIGAGCGGGTVQIYNTSVVDNYAYGLGGGILLGGFDDVVENSTVSGNQADEYGRPDSAGLGAILSGFGTVRFSTFANNAGGGLALSDQMHAFGNLVQNNAGRTGNCWTGPLASDGYNVSSDASCGFGAATDLASTDAMLQPLADNGGGLPTHALVAHSPATDLVPAADCPVATDERGTARPQGANCDAGAFEWVDSTPPVFAAHANITTPATGPAGATVTYTPPAATDDLGVASAGCLPASGATFPVGDTTITCTATDLRGNVGIGTFKVHVQGVTEQIYNLLVLVGGVGPGNSLTAKVASVLGAVAIGHPRLACPLLQALANEVQAQSGKKIPAAKATAILTAIGQIRDALDC
jgi:hypothetical protein